MFIVLRQLETALRAMKNYIDRIIPKKVSDLQNDAEYITENDVPTSLSEFTNDAGFITESDISTPDWTATSSEPGYINNKPNILPGAGQMSIQTNAGHTVTGTQSASFGAQNNVSGNFAFSVGVQNTVSGGEAFAAGNNNIANHESQFVFGQFNAADPSNTEATQRGTYVEIVGNGSGQTASGEFKRSNARTLDWEGNQWIAGNMKVGGTSYDDSNAVEVATKNDIVTPDWEAAEGEDGYIANKPAIESGSGEGSVHMCDADAVASGYMSFAMGEGSLASGKFSYASGQASLGSIKITGTKGTTVYTLSAPITNSFTLSAINHNRAIINYGKVNADIIGINNDATEITVSKSLSETNDLNNVTCYLIRPSVASGIASHAEGSSHATGRISHSEGSTTLASGNYSHAEGGVTVASGSYSHAEGSASVASGTCSHAEGLSTIANHKSQHASGEYNVEDPSTEAATARGTYVEIVGNGTGAARSNARTLDWSGNEWLAGNLKVGGTGYDDVNAKTVGVIDDTAGSGDVDKTWSADKITSELTNIEDIKIFSGTWVDSDDPTVTPSHFEFDDSSMTDADFYNLVNNNNGETVFALYVDFPDKYQAHTIKQYFYLDGKEDNYLLFRSAALTHDQYGRCFNSFIAFSCNTYVDPYTYSWSYGMDSIDIQVDNNSIIHADVANIESNKIAFNGLAKAAGDTSQASSGNPIGTYTDTAKTKIKAMLGVTDPESEIDDTAGSGDTDKTWSADKIASELANAGSVQDVTVNGTSIVNNGVAEIPVTTPDWEAVEGENGYILNKVDLHAGEGIDSIQNSYSSASGDYSYAEGKVTESSGKFSHAEGISTEASGDYSHAEGLCSVAKGFYSHAEGGNLSRPIYVSGDAESTTYTLSREITNNYVKEFLNKKRGLLNYNNNGWVKLIDFDADNGTITLEETLSQTALNNALVNFMTYSLASFSGTHAEGVSMTTAALAHAEGINTIASGQGSHSEGNMTLASGSTSHAEGGSCTASGTASHAEGAASAASGIASHAEGYNTIANHKSQHASGEFNIEDPSTEAATARGNYIEIVGNGSNDAARSNARTLDWSGNEWIAGKFKMGGTSYDDVNAKEVETAVLASAPLSESAPIVTIENGEEGMPVKELTFDIEPVQDLHGYDNPWPEGGGKNLLPNTLETTTLNGVTATVNSDGSVTLNGTATANIIFNICTEEIIFSEVADYILNGGADGGGESTYRLYGEYYNYSQEAWFGTARTTSGDGTTLTTDKFRNVRIQVFSGAVVNNVTFYPMIRKATETDATYAPYSNICPITGYTGAEIVRTGKNLFDADTFYVSYKQSDSSFIMSGNAAAGMRYFIPPELVNKRLTFSAYIKRTSGSTLTNIRAAAIINGSRINGNMVSDETYTLSQVTFTPTSGNDCIWITFGTSGSQSLQVKDIQLELGSEATEYEPYTGATIPITFPTEAGTVYGGHVEIKDGETKLVVTHVKRRYLSTEYWAWNDSIKGFLASADGIKSGSHYSDNSALCNNFTKVSTSTGQTIPCVIIGNANRIAFCKLNTIGITDAATWKTYLDNNDVEVTYPLATPIEYTLDPVTLTTIQGLNHIWTNTGDIESLTYITNPGIYELIAGTVKSKEDVKDVTVNGASVVTNGVAEIPVASDTEAGIVKVGIAAVTNTKGVCLSEDNTLQLLPASNGSIKSGIVLRLPIVPATQHKSVFYGLSKVAGVDLANETVTLGTYPDNAKSAIKAMLGVGGETQKVTVSGTAPTIVANQNTRYVCGEVVSLDFTPSAEGICDVIFTSGSTVAVLTIPNTVMFPEWFDPTSLEANKTYEISVSDGVYGAVMIW